VCAGLKYLLQEGYRMETGEDLVKFKENRSPTFPAEAWLVAELLGM
jgi:hypothetical protein